MSAVDRFRRMASNDFAEEAMPNGPSPTRRRGPSSSPLQGSRAVGYAPASPSPLAPRRELARTPRHGDAREAPSSSGAAASTATSTAAAVPTPPQVFTIPVSAVPMLAPAPLARHGSSMQMKRVGDVFKSLKNLEEEQAPSFARRGGAVAAGAAASTAGDADGSVGDGAARRLSVGGGSSGSGSGAAADGARGAAVNGGGGGGGDAAAAPSGSRRPSDGLSVGLQRKPSSEAMVRSAPAHDDALSAARRQAVAEIAELATVPIVDGPDVHKEQREFEASGGTRASPLLPQRTPRHPVGHILRDLEDMHDSRTKAVVGAVVPFSNRGRGMRTPSPLVPRRMLSASPAASPTARAGVPHHHSIFAQQSSLAPRADSPQLTPTADDAFDVQVLATPLTPHLGVPPAASSRVSSLPAAADSAPSTSSATSASVAPQLPSRQPPSSSSSTAAPSASSASSASSSAASASASAPVAAAAASSPGGASTSAVSTASLSAAPSAGPPAVRSALHAPGLAVRVHAPRSVSPSSSSSSPSNQLTPTSVGSVHVPSASDVSHALLARKGSRATLTVDVTPPRSLSRFPSTEVMTPSNIFFSEGDVGEVRAETSTSASINFSSSNGSSYGSGGGVGSGGLPKRSIALSAPQPSPTASGSLYASPVVPAGTAAAGTATNGRGHSVFASPSGGSPASASGHANGALHASGSNNTRSPGSDDGSGGYGLGFGAGGTVHAGGAGGSGAVRRPSVPSPRTALGPFGIFSPTTPYAPPLLSDDGDVLAVGNVPRRPSLHVTSPEKRQALAAAGLGVHGPVKVPSVALSRAAAGPVERSPPASVVYEDGSPASGRSTPRTSRSPSFRRLSDALQYSSGTVTSE
jgi:hypothetical protein